MIIWDSPEAVNQWVGQQGGGYAFPGSCTALGYVDETGRLTAGLVFSEANGAHCLVNLAINNGVFPPSLLKAGLKYVFNQLKLKRLTFVIKEGNIPSIRLVRKLGATHEATLREADITGNMLIFALFPNNCLIWSKINGQISGRNAQRAGPHEDHWPPIPS